MTGQAALFELEDRGYGYGVSTLIMPNGSHLCYGHDADEWGNVLIREVYSQYLNGDAS